MLSLNTRFTIPFKLHPLPSWSLCLRPESPARREHQDEAISDPLPVSFEVGGLELRAYPLLWLLLLPPFLTTKGRFHLFSPERKYSVSRKRTGCLCAANRVSKPIGVSSIWVWASVNYLRFGHNIPSASRRRTRFVPLDLSSYSSRT